MRRSLQELQQALAGVVGFSAALEELAGALFNNLLPSSWGRLCPPTSRPLTSWLLWMQRRHEQFVSWVQVSLMLLESCILIQQLSIVFGICGVESRLKANFDWRDLKAVSWIQPGSAEKNLAATCETCVDRNEASADCFTLYSIHFWVIRVQKHYDRWIYGLAIQDRCQGDALQSIAAPEKARRVSARPSSPLTACYMPRLLNS